MEQLNAGNKAGNKTGDETGDKTGNEAGGGRVRNLLCPSGCGTGECRAEKGRSFGSDTG